MKVSLLLLIISVTDAFVILRRNTRVVSGRPADITEYPYQVSVLVNELHLCGGSIISPYFVITAAHCIDGETANGISVQAGVTTIDVEEGGFTARKEKLYEVERIYEHPKFSFWNYEYDIAILKLKKKLPRNRNIKSIGLPDAADSTTSLAGKMATVTGWGVTLEKTTKMSTDLQATEVVIIPLEECINDYPYDGITQTMVCAGDGQHDSCFGDSGGPLAVDNTLIGVVSWGYACGERNRPGVYTSISAVRDFIKDKTGL